MVRRFAWIVGETAPERRGAAIGTAVSAAVAGASLGPVLGTAATVVGRPAAFSGFAVLVGVVIVWLRELPSTHVRSDQGMANILAALARMDFAVPFWLMTLPAIASGLIAVLGPLRIDALGGTASLIGATFLVSAGAEIIISPLAGEALGPARPAVPAPHRTDYEHSIPAALQPSAEPRSARCRDRRDLLHARTVLGSCDGDARGCRHGNRSRSGV